MDFQSFLSSSKQQNHQIEEIIQILKSEIEVFQVQLSKLHKNSSKSTNSSSTRKISKEIIENFKSHWDFKVELEDIESKLHNFNSLDSKLDSKFPTDQIQNLNERKKEILEKLYLNMKEKQRLQKLVMEINDGSRREMIQLQIQIRNLKLEKLKLVEKNSCFRIEAENAKRENSQKDQIINQMKEQIEDMKGRLMRQKSAPNIGGLLMSPIKVNSNHSPTISKPSHRASSSLQQARFQSKLRGKQTYFGKTIQNFLKLYTCQTKPQIQQSSLSPTHPSKSPQKLSSICTRPKSRAIQNKLPSSSPSPVRHPSKQKLSNPLILKLHSNPNPSILRPRDHNIQYLQLKKFE